MYINLSHFNLEISYTVYTSLYRKLIPRFHLAKCVHIDCLAAWHIYLPYHFHNVYPPKRDGMSKYTSPFHSEGPGIHHLWIAVTSVCFPYHILAYLKGSKIILKIYYKMHILLIFYAVIGFEKIGIFFKIIFFRIYWEETVLAYSYYTLKLFFEFCFWIIDINCLSF